MVPLTGSEVVWCTLRWPVVCWPLEELLLLLVVEEKLKEEEVVKLLEEDMVVVVGGLWLGGWWGCLFLEGSRGCWMEVCMK